MFALFQQTPRLQFFLIGRCFLNRFNLIFVNGVQLFVAALFDTTLQCVLFSTRPTCFDFSLPTFLLSPDSFLATVLLPCILSSLVFIFATFVPLCVPILTFSTIPDSLACSSVYSLRCDVHDSLVPFSRVFTVTFRRQPAELEPTRMRW